VVDFDVLAQSVHADAAVERTKRIEAYFKWAIMVMLIFGAIIFAINDLYDRPLTYDGAGLPSVPVPGTVGMDLPSLKKPYADPDPSPPLPKAVITSFGYRLSPIREQLTQANKGDLPAPKTTKTPKAMIADGLRFLALNQAGDGGWPVAIIPIEWRAKDDQCGNYVWGRVGVSSLALLCFLGEGETWPFDPSKKVVKPGGYSDKVEKTVRFLMKSQDTATGRFGPLDGAPGMMYNHGMATLALCEAGGISGDTFIREAAQKGLDFIVRAQTTKGGWNYLADSAGQNDISVSAWQVQALCAGREAGLTIPREVFAKALAYYREATQAEGHVLYRLENRSDTQDRENKKVNNCAVALMIRQLLGDDPRVSTDLRKLIQVVGSAPPPSKKHWGGKWVPDLPNNDDGPRSFWRPYVNYFATYGLFFSGGKDWQNWNDAMKAATMEMQLERGQWQSNDEYGWQGGTAYCTALCVLTLQVYYRIESGLPGQRVEAEK
jgi:hypothetical protein